MKVEIERFLAFAALFAACLAGCTVETTTSGLGATSTTGPTGGPGTTSTSSSSTSTAGAGGAGGSSTGAGGSAGSPDDGGLDVSQPDDAGACFADDPDAGDAGVAPCSSLGYANVNCGDDAMAEPPLGAFICTDLEGDLKLAAMRELVDCLKTIPGADGGDDACSMAHEMAASACSVQLFSRRTCSVPAITVDGGVQGCAEIVASCPSDGGAGGISLGDCQRFLSPFNDAAREFIISCYFDPNMPQGANCADKFENVCVFPDP
jgi:hypothetical protein